MTFRTIAKLASSPSQSLLLWVGSFILGIVGATIISPSATSTQALPFAFGSLALAIVVGFAVKNKNARLLAVAGLLLVSGVARYLSASGDPIDLLAYWPTLLAIKMWMVNTVGQMLPEPHAGFLNGLLVGGGVRSPELKTAFVATGTAHVMALSGWNISLINKWLSRTFRSFRFGKQACWFLTAACVAIFVIMTGAGASLVRAAVMSVFATVAMASGRRSSGGRAVVYAAALMLLVSPRIIITDIGFLLSLSAMLGLIYLSPFFAPFAKRLPDRFDLRGTAAATVGATLATLPVSLVAFGQTSLVALPTNVLLLPFIAPTMLVGFLGAIISSLVPAFTGFCGIITMFFTNYDISVVRLFARAPGASLVGLQFNLFAATIMVAGMVWIVIKHHDDLIKKNN